MPGQVEVIRDHLADALARGGTALVGGAESVRAPYVEPVVLADVPDTSTAVTDETFGPTVTLHRVANLDDAVARVNAGRYGLGAAVFSGRRGTEIAGRLRCGMVAVNSVISYAAVPGAALRWRRRFGIRTGPRGRRSARVHPGQGGHPAPVPAAGAGAHLRPSSLGHRLLLRIVRVLYGR